MISESMRKAGIKAGLIIESKKGVLISLQHAESLTALLEWHKQMIAAFHQDRHCDKKGSEKFLTIAYCDELIEALKVKKGNDSGQQKAT